ncbi:sodium/hydrogen exchanger 9B2-like [Clavelina lepadiformis]|uniref:Cation/H+ exchanger transmembrane domain-containing protein n=1 Tax=Clavelina lepadiformis TaxID=159417 RepID=A0ABP0GKY4_CLALP
MLKSLSSQTLTRADSGIDIVSIDSQGVNCQCYRSSSVDTPLPGECQASQESCRSEADTSVTDSQTWKKRLCPPRGTLANYFTAFLMLCLLFGAVWALLPERMLPNHSQFSLFMTIVLCFVAEQLVVKIPTPKGFPPLPPLLASLLMGLALKNLPEPLNLAEDIDEETSTILRELSLTVILTRAGLEIDAEGMRKVKWAVVRLAFMPCIAETTVIGILGHYILGFPFEWSFMTGFMIAAVSPAVVIPCLIILQDAGFGVSKGVPALVMAASGIDDVLAIAGFTVLLGIAIPTGLTEEIEEGPGINLYEISSAAPDTSSFHNNHTGTPSTIFGPPINIGKEVGSAAIEVVIGIIAGLVLGFFISYIPPRTMRHKSFCRGFLLLGIGVLFVFGTEVWGIPGSGALCALITSFTASLHWKDEREPLEKAWHYMWLWFQPILFGLTGTLVEVEMLTGTSVILGLAVLACGLVGRLLMSTSVTFGLNFSLKERLFVSAAWIPKGTVQAALGSTAYDMARHLKRPPHEIEWGKQILVMAVLITLITAPVGALLISALGPKLLTSNSGLGPNPEDNQAYEDTESQNHNKGDHGDSPNPSTDCTKDYHHHHHHHHNDCRRGSYALEMNFNGLEEIEEEEDLGMETDESSETSCSL